MNERRYTTHEYHFLRMSQDGCPLCIKKIIIDKKLGHIIQEIGQNMIASLSSLLWTEMPVKFFSIHPSLKRLE